MLGQPAEKQQAKKNDTPTCVRAADSLSLSNNNHDNLP